jgi:MoaA/NifB/PqqE/SkfB family radical SAM enzyme
MQIAEKPLLKVEALYDENGIKLIPKGPLAAVARPAIDQINRAFRDEKPISYGQDRIIFSTWIPPAPSLAFDRLISAQIGALTGRRIPDQFSIAIIRACPNDCIHCSAPTRQGEILSREVVERAIKEAMDMGSYLITFDGGEPLLRKDLPEMVSAVDNRAIPTCFSSGYHLTEDLARRLKQAGLYAIRISIDSPHKEEHDRVRGRIGAFEDALTGIKNALQAGLLVDLFMVTSPSNIDDLEDTFSLASDLGVHELSLYEIVAVGRWASRSSEVLTPDDILRMERFYKEKNRGRGPKVTAFPYQLSANMFGCFAGRKWLHVDSSGDALPCAYMPVPFGNIKERSLKDIWNEMSRYRWFRGKCACQMKDAAFRGAHPQILNSR